MKREEVIDLPEPAFGYVRTDKSNQPMFSATQVREYGKEVERRTIEKCVAVIQSYQIPYGNSAAGEIAAEMTLSMLREVRDEIRALQQQEKQ